MSERPQLLCTLALASMLALVARSAPATAANDATPGSVVVARTKPSGLIIWDSAPVVADIVKNKASDSAANALLQRDALLLIVKLADQFVGAKDVRVRILYSKTGDVSPVYGTATFTGIERYAELTLDREQIVKDTGHWREAARGTGALPAFCALKIVGSLPPR